MEYGIKELAEMSGLTTRTLRYYDEIDLLKPARVTDSGYRVYNSKDLECLQQILFYRKRGFELKQIKELLDNPNYDVAKALKEHLAALEKEKENINSLIENIKLTILAMEGEYEMGDKERFEALKEDLIKKNETEYGQEAREKYGDETVEESYKKILGMNEEKWQRFSALEEAIKEKLEIAVNGGQTPESEIGKEITTLHKEWIMMTWKQYSGDAHKGLAMMYVCDERFKAYYDEKGDGRAEFLQKAIEYWA